MSRKTPIVEGQFDLFSQTQEVVEHVPSVNEAEAPAFSTVADTINLQATQKAGELAITPAISADAEQETEEESVFGEDTKVAKIKADIKKIVDRYAPLAYEPDPENKGQTKLNPNYDEWNIRPTGEENEPIRRTIKRGAIYNKALRPLITALDTVFETQESRRLVLGHDRTLAKNRTKGTNELSALQKLIGENYQEFVAKYEEEHGRKPSPEECNKNSKAFEDKIRQESSDYLKYENMLGFLIAQYKNEHADYIARYTPTEELRKYDRHLTMEEYVIPATIHIDKILRKILPWTEQVKDGKEMITRVHSPEEAYKDRKKIAKQLRDYEKLKELKAELAKTQRLDHKPAQAATRKVGATIVAKVSDQELNRVKAAEQNNEGDVLASHTSSVRAREEDLGVSA